jgi:DNA-binding SARP family transcriptional activator
MDPERAFPADHFLAADKNTVALDVDHMELDLVSFLSDVEAGRRLERAGQTSEAANRYRSAAARYGGDFLEEDPFEEWSVAPRDEAQAAYLSVIRFLAAASATGGEDAAATGLYLRILERDPYDEAAHLGLVEVLAATGRHGEARRRYGIYQARMEEIEVEATPFPSPGSMGLRQSPGARSSRAPAGSDARLAS